MNIFEDDLLRLFGSHGFTWTPGNKKKQNVLKIKRVKGVVILICDVFVSCGLIVFCIFIMTC